jgi:hypothetical protein
LNFPGFSFILNPRLKMKKLIVSILMSLSVAAFAEEFTWSDFEALVEKAYGKSAYAAYEYYAENPQCFFVEEAE